MQAAPRRAGVTHGVVLDRSIGGRPFEIAANQGLAAPKHGKGADAESQLFCYSEPMKTTVTMTARGVITLPAKLRHALGLKADDQLIAEPTADGLLLRPAVTLPIEMYTPERVREFDAAEADLAALLAKSTTPTAPTPKPKQRRPRAPRRP